MLKEKETGKYSQSRIYLLWSIIAYYLTLGILTFGGLKPDYGLDMEKFVPESIHSHNLPPHTYTSPIVTSTGSIGSNIPCAFGAEPL